MNILKKFLPAVLAALLLGSCAETASSAVSSAAALPAPEKAEQSAETAEPVELTSLQPQYISYGGFAADGLYYFKNTARADLSVNLMYLDYASMTKIYLCNQPNCTHENDSCNSYQPHTEGGTLIEAVGNQILLLARGKVSANQENTVLPHLDVMNLDGSDRRTIMTFETNQEFNTPMITDGQSVYGVRTTVQEGAAKRELVKIDPLSKTVSVLLDMEPYWLQGAAGESFVLSDRERNYYYLYSARTGTITEIFHETDPWQSTKLYGTVLAFKKSGRFCLYDLKTGTETTLPGYLIPGRREANVSLIDADETHLLFRVRTLADQLGSDLDDGFYVLTADSEPQRWDLTYQSEGEQYNVERITSVQEDRYLVMVQQGIPQYDPETGYTVGGEDQYALISREDYWNGIANYTLAHEP